MNVNRDLRAAIGNCYLDVFLNFCGEGGGNNLGWSAVYLLISVGILNYIDPEP